MSRTLEATPFQDRRLTAAALMGMLVWLASCAPPGGFTLDPDNAPIGPRPLVRAQPVMVQPIQLTHEVAFPSGRSELSAGEARLIDGFIAKAEIRYGDIVSLGHGTAADVRAQDLAGRRTEAVARHLTDRGFEVAGNIAEAGGGDRIAIVVDRYLAVAAECPNWDSLMAGTGVTDKVGAFGCMTNSALANMAADPRDLVEGDSLGPADATYTTRKFRIYQVGKARKPKAVKTRK